MQQFDLATYLASGVEGIVKNALKATLSNPKESLFMGKYAAASKKATKRREQLEAQGQHIPPFLIASITSTCNLHCAGCYSRANNACHDAAATNQLSADEWAAVFDEATESGIGFILLAGGEPMVRRDVIEEAAKRPNILFPVFTNGTMNDDAYLRLFDHNRNLIPIISVEGGEDTTDNRRGEGVYRTLRTSMQTMNERGILFGASITVTAQNIREVMSDEFIADLRNQGCQVIIYVEYVPVDGISEHLAPGDEERAYAQMRLDTLRPAHEDMVLISFPGDEKASGGCLAAGRGFFHINSHGGAEPCPFSPYSDINVREVGLVGAMNSPLFTSIHEQDLTAGDHIGGCTLFERRSEVETLVFSAAAMAS